MTGRPAGSCPPDFENVIPLGRRRDRATTPREERMAAAAYGDPSPEERLAETAETLFAARGRSLTDPATAEAYDTALELALLIVDGAFCQQGIDESMHGRIRGMFEEARHAPRTLSGLV